MCQKLPTRPPNALCYTFNPAFIIGLNGLLAGAFDLLTDILDAAVAGGDNALCRLLPTQRIRQSMGKTSIRLHAFDKELAQKISVHFAFRFDSDKFSNFGNFHTIIKTLLNHFPNTLR